MPESLSQFHKEVERIDGLILGAVPQYGTDPVQTGVGASVPERYTEALAKIREKYDTQIRLYEQERARCLLNIQHLPTQDQSQAIYLYVIEDKSWEQISVERHTTFEAAKALCLRAIDSYERLYGSEQEISDLIYRA
jgi:hypothetical protein